MKSGKIINSTFLAGMVIGIAFIIGGIFNIVSSDYYMREYENSTDIREVDAVVQYCTANQEKDELGIMRTESYDMKLEYEVEGKTYTVKQKIKGSDKAFAEDLERGDTIALEVYRTSKGEYRLPPNSGPLDFLLACVVILMGCLFSGVVLIDCLVKVRKKAVGKSAEKRRKG